MLYPLGYEGIIDILAINSGSTSKAARMGLEPMTYRLGGGHSIHLSYRTMINTGKTGLANTRMVESAGTRIRT